MDYIELLITVSVAFLVTVLYIVFRKFIKWAVEDDNKFYTRNGCLGSSKKSREIDKKLSIDKLTEGYALIMLLLVIYIIKLILEAA